MGHEMQTRRWRPPTSLRDPLVYPFRLTSTSMPSSWMTRASSACGRCATMRKCSTPRSIKARHGVLSSGEVAYTNTCGEQQPQRAGAVTYAADTADGPPVLTTPSHARAGRGVDGIGARTSNKARSCHTNTCCIKWDSGWLPRSDDTYPSRMRRGLPPGGSGLPLRTAATCASRATVEPLAASVAMSQSYGRNPMVRTVRCADAA